jgi:energy-coupling factor transporter ATP-binding protein EcfA2
MPEAMVPVIEEEFDQAGAIGVARIGIRTLAAATILAHGTDLQKEKYLLRILTGEDTWCQLFSEPGSGSDVAGAVTRAEFQGNQWVVNGQKVWTTSAHKAHWGLLLARTTRDAPPLLILDEPTNHLDIDARDALVKALNAYQGAVLLITHDPQMVELVADRLWLVDGGTVKPFEGDLDEYRSFLADKARGGARPNGAPPKKDEKRERAEKRASLAPMQQKLKQLETDIAKLEAEGKMLANIWDVKAKPFPVISAKAGGATGTTPVATFPQNGYGLFDMTGNAWQWVADWYRSDYFTQQASNAGKRAIIDPQGPTDAFDPSDPGVPPNAPKRVIRGGSFLCNEDYCMSYRPSARRGTDPYNPMSHIGFRLAQSG